MRGCPHCKDKDARVAELEAELEATRIDADDAVARHDGILRQLKAWHLAELLDLLEREGITWLEPDDGSPPIAAP